MRLSSHLRQVKKKTVAPLSPNRHKSVKNAAVYYGSFIRSHTLALHEHISEALPFYANWHDNPKHKRVHRVVLHTHNSIWALILIAVVTLSLFSSVFASNLDKGVSLKEEWEQGTLVNLETDDPSGDLKVEASGAWDTRVLKTPPQPITTGATGAFYNNKLYVFRGNLDNDFYAYDAAKNSWATLKETPIGVGQGAHITSDGAGTLYAIFGGYTKTFYKYSVADNSWTKLSDISDVTGVQSSIIYASGKVYLLRANNSQDFFAYDPGTDDWNALNILPNAAGNGGALAYDGTRYIYALRGNNAAAATAMYRFDIQSPAWQLMTTTGMPTINYQTDIQYVSGSLYIQNGNNTTTFSVCPISDDTCTVSTTTVFPAATSAGILAYNSADSLLYSLRGNNTYDFWKFNPETSEFVGPSLFGEPASATPVGFVTGADLIYDGSAGIYGLKGGAAASGFYYYTIATGSWAARTTTGLPTLSYDTKAIKVGNYIYLFAGNSTAFYRYDTTNDPGGWAAVTAAPASVRNGASLAYPGSGDYIYALRGNSTSVFYAYSISNGNWTTFDPVDLPTGVVADVGARIVADATDVYAILGNGNTAFYKYNISGNNWTQVGRVPFAPYYGSDLTINSGKIYAVAGNYSFATYEYSGGSWRKLQDLPKYSQLSPFYYDAGAYNGASIEAAGASGLFVERGNGSSELLNCNPQTTKYLTSGSYESQAFDLTYVASWNSLTKNVTTPSGTSVVFETKTSNDGTNWTNWAAVSGDTITSATGRYIKVKITLNSSPDQLQTPTVSDFNISYSADGSKPTSPATVHCYSQQVGGSELTSGTAYKYSHPFCSWSGATDSESGIAGYYVYVGADQNADPADLGTGSFYVTSASTVINNLTANGNSYIRIKTKDNAGNISDTVYDDFVYNYQGVAPITTVTKTDTADFTGTLSGLSATNDQLKLNSKDGFWKESRLTPAPTNASAASLVVKNGTIYEARGSSVTFDSYDIASDVWNAVNPADLPVALAAGGSIVNGPGDYIYAIRGGAATTQNFYRFDGSTWTDLSSVAPIPGTVSTGSAATYDGSRYIYVMRGNGDDGFYRYDTQGTNGQWATRSNVNFGYPNQTNSVAPTTGSSLVSDGANTIYAIQGAYAGGFAKYTVSTNTWTPLDPLPMIPSGGSTLSWDSASQTLIFIPGNTSNKMYQYNPSTGAWTSLAKSVISFAAGTASVAYNGNLYTIRGGTTAFYQYNIAKDTWYLPTAGFFGSNYLGSTNYNFGPGSSLARDNSQNIYMLRGSYDNVFVRYNTTNGITTKLANFPTGAYDGASLTFVQSENVIYGIAGNSDKSLFKYSIATNTWSEISTDLLPAAPGAGASLVWDGNQYLYYIRGAASNAWYRYDLTATESPRWSNILSVTGLSGTTFGAGSEAVIKSGKLYIMRAQGNMTFWTIDLGNPTTGSWSQLTALPTTPSPFTATTVAGDAFLMDGNDGYLYLAKGNTTNEFYRYSISGNAWARVSNIPSVIYPGTTNGGASAVSVGEKIFVSPGNTAGVGAYNDGLMTYVTPTSTTGFEEKGVYTSDSLDLQKNYDWANLTAAFTTQSNTNVLIETSSSSDNSAWSPWVTVSDGKTISGSLEYVINSPVARYLRVRVTLTSSDGVYSPTLDYLKVNYYRDNAAPSNPLAVASAKTKQTGGVDLVNAAWTNTVEPYFTLPEEDVLNGATDNSGGSGVDCYYVYFGTDALATPSTLSQCTTALSYKFSPAENGATYHLLVQTKDKAGNLQGEIKELFTMKLDINAPTDPDDLSVNPENYTNVDSYTFTTSELADDAESQTKPTLQYRTGGDQSGVWYDFPAGQQQVTIPNENHPQGKYRAGINEFFVRVKDSAGNVSSGTKTVQYKFGAVAPSQPMNLNVDHATSTQNNFTFTWDPPTSFIGDVNRITYYYSVGPEPNQYNTNSTSATAVGPGPFAIQRGENKFYVVAKDEAGNIDWHNFSVVSFTADTAAPAAPTDVNVNDISDKDADQYRLVISWMAPTIEDESNFAGYDIYESSEEFGTYTKLANTSGTAYVHTGLAKDSKHYYYIKSVDKTNNSSVASSVTLGTATGRYKKPPNIVKEPSVAVKAKSAVFTWATSREANTTVEYGKTEELGKLISNPLTTYVTDHEIAVTGLDPSTKYYYKAYFTDPDGNIGNSEIGSFITDPAPTISGLKVEDITLSSMLITWYSNVPSYGSIAYGETQALSENVTEEPYFTKQHVVRLSGLDNGTLYFIQVRATDEEGNAFNSDIYEEETIPLPVVTNVKVENKKNVDSPTVLVTYDTNVETSTIVKYSASGVNQREAITSEFATSHSIEISNMVALRDYTLQASGADKYGNVASVSLVNITTLSDTMPPTIKNLTDQKKIVGEGDSAETQLTVKVSANESSTVIVQAAKGVSATDFNISSSQDSLSTDHTITLNLGEPGMPYTYRVIARDAAGNETVSDSKTIVVSSSTKSVFEYIVSAFSRSFGWLSKAFK